MVDSDLYGAVAQYDANWVENSWVQTVAPIDCSANPYGPFRFNPLPLLRQRASDGSEKCFVEVSRDGELGQGLRRRT